MSEIFDYVQHPHVEKRKAAGPPTVAAAVPRCTVPARSAASTPRSG